MKQKEAIFHLKQAIINKVKAEIQTNLDTQCAEVLQQKTRFFKFKCFVIWGHLYRDGVCLRCQKVEQSKK